MLKIGARQPYASLPPTQIVPRLADEGIYLASESTFYRILHQHQQIHHRGRSQAAKKVAKPTSHIAVAPCQVWTWDITWLPTYVKGQYFYLYLIEDIFSRKIVGYEVYGEESGDYYSGHCLESAVLISLWCCTRIMVPL